jgi:tetratricopeptide (TPR) repeat protein
MATSKLQQVEITTNALLAGRYRVLGILGQGGMGTVWRVKDQVKGCEVALKTIRSTGEVTPAQELAFREEYRAMTRLRHPNTIEVFDFGVLDARTRYLTMAMVPGRELLDVIAGRAMPFEQAYTLLIQLLRALDFIHSRLYVHRDIKAANVRVRDDNTLVLMDFGLMAQLGTPSTGGMSGSPGYMPPEGIRGGMIDASADLYSAGCLAFEMLTGRVPFTGSLRDVLRHHVETSAPLLRTRRADAPEALERIVAKLLEKDPCKRYRRAADALHDLAAVAGMEAACPDQAQAQSYLVAGAMVGRDRELAALDEALQQALTGAGQALLVGAPGGTGKSRLVAEHLVQARLIDVMVLEGRCREGRQAPYGPLVEALQPLRAILALDDVDHAAALDLIFREQAPGTGELLAAPDDQQRRAAHEQLADWLALASVKQPLVLALDDLQWADALTLDAVRALSRRVDGMRVLLLGALRDDEPGAAPLLRSAEDGALALLRLAPFSPDQVTALLDATLREYRIDGPVQERLVATTGGNAFFLTETLRLLMDEGALKQHAGTWIFPASAERLDVPATVDAAVLRRFAGLTDSARQVARAAAVIGPHPCRAGLLALAGGQEEQFFAELDLLVARQVLRREDDGYTFFHDRVREAIYAGINDEDGSELHYQHARWLEVNGDLRDPGTVNALAFHYGRGTCSDKAYHFHCRAAELSLAAGALPCAIGHWQEAVASAKTGNPKLREERLAAAYWEIGSRGTIIATEAAIEALKALIPILENVCEVECWADRLKTIVGWVRRMPKARREHFMLKMMTPEPYVHKARTGWRAWLPPHLPSWLPRLIEAYGFLGAAYGFAGQPEKGLAIADKSLELLPFPGTPLEGSLRLVRCTNLFPAGRLDELQAEAAVAVHLLSDTRFPCPPHTRRLTRAAATGYRLASAHQGAKPDEDLLAAAHAAAQDHGAYDVINEALHAPALWAANSGRHAQVRPWIQEVFARCVELEAPLDPNALYLDAVVRLQTGDVDGARTQAERGLAYTHLPEGSNPRLRLMLMQGHALLAGGDTAGAAEVFDAVRGVAECRGMGQIRILALLGRGYAALMRGEAAVEPLELARELSADGPLRNPLLEAQAERFLALTDATPAEARKRLQRVKDAVVALDNPLEQAHTLFALGEIQAKAGDRQGTLGAWNLAARRYRELGCTHFEARVAKHLAALPAEKPRPVSNGSGPLPGPAPRPAAPIAANWMVARAFQL